MEIDEQCILVMDAPSMQYTHRNNSNDFGKNFAILLECIFFCRSEDFKFVESCRWLEPLELRLSLVHSVVVLSFIKIVSSVRVIVFHITELTKG